MAKRNDCRWRVECARLARDILGAAGIVDDYPIVPPPLNLETVYTYEGTHDVHTLILGERITGKPAYNG